MLYCRPYSVIVLFKPSKYSGNPQTLTEFSMLIKHSKKTIQKLSPWTVTALCASVFAQDNIQNLDDELEYITLDRPSFDEEAPEEEFSDLIFDETIQQYRLIEAINTNEEETERNLQVRELQRLFNVYREALENEDFLEADTLAKRVVELSIKLNGLDSHDSAKAITNLGIAQHKNGDFESALRNFIASIDIVERIDDNLSEALINPLQGLAASQASVGRPDLARLSYQRAVHVSHVNDGPHNSDQIDILESLAELHISQSDFTEAGSIQDHIFAIQSRNLDLLSIDLIPALERKALWQHRLQRYDQERSIWREIIKITQHHFGKESLELIAPLSSLGRTYLFANPNDFEFQPDVSAKSGDGYLRRANRIAERHPDSDWKIVKDTLLQLADYYQLSGRPSKASKSYRETWDLLSQEDSGKLKARVDHLEKVKILKLVFPPKYYNSARKDSEPQPNNFQTATTSFSLTVTASGRVTNVKHIETQPQELESFSTNVSRSLRRIIYRPRMEEGKMVPTEEVFYTHEFFYRPSDLQQAPISERDNEIQMESL